MRGRRCEDRSSFPLNAFSWCCVRLNLISGSVRCQREQSYKKLRVYCFSRMLSATARGLLSVLKVLREKKTNGNEKLVHIASV